MELNNASPLCQNDNLRHHQIIIFIRPINDAALYRPLFNSAQQVSYILTYFTFLLQDDALSGLTDRSEPGASAPSSARSHSPFTASFNQSSIRGRDNCIGRVCIGANVRGEKERGHWMSVMSNPRKVFTLWQTLY